MLVTGGTRGIGRAIALRLVADGAARAVLGYMRNDSAAEEAAAVVEEAGAELGSSLQPGRERGSRGPSSAFDEAYPSRSSSSIFSSA